MWPRKSQRLKAIKAKIGEESAVKDACEDIVDS